MKARTGLYGNYIISHFYIQGKIYVCVSKEGTSPNHWTEIQPRVFVIQSVNDQHNARLSPPQKDIPLMYFRRRKLEYSASLINYLLADFLK